MDRERLGILPFEILQDIALRSGITRIDDLDKETLIGQILEALEEERTDRDRSNNIEMLVKEKKFELNPDDNLEYPEIEALEPPETYGETRLVLMLRDPSWAFAYWDLSVEHRDLTGGDDEVSGLLLRVYGESDADAKNNRSYFDIPIRDDERRRYINLPRTGISYSAELIARYGSTEQTLCRSNSVDSPDSTIEHLAEGEEKIYVGILSVAGLQDIDESILRGAIPQRIISLLDTQYLHLKG